MFIHIIFVNNNLFRMEQVLKYVGNSAMLSISPKAIRQKKIDMTTRLEQIDDNESDIISFRIIRPQGFVFPKLKEKLSISPEIEALMYDPVYLTEEQLADPRIKHLLNEDFR